MIRSLHRASLVRNGYTLIELLLVVAILGLAAVMLIPQLALRGSLEVQAAVRQIIADLSFAQSDAVARQAVRRVHFYDDGSGYGLLHLDDVSDVATAFDEGTAVYLVDPTENDADPDYTMIFGEDRRFDMVTIESTNIDGVGGRTIHYDSLGGTVMSGGGPGLGGTIIVSGDGHRYEITIEPFTGKLTVRPL